MKTAAQLQVRAVNPNTARAKYDRLANVTHKPDDFEVSLGGSRYVVMWSHADGRRVIRLIDGRGQSIPGGGMWLDERQTSVAEWAHRCCHQDAKLDEDALVEAARLLQVVAELT